MTSTLALVTCEHCIYFARFESGKIDIGYCKIDPPVIIPATSSKRGHFPIMNTSDWCGQGKDKDGNTNS